MRRFSRVNRRGVTARTLAASLATLMLWAAGPAHGDPADIFQIGAPAVGSDPPKTADIQVGDTSVATQTGSFDYSYPIEVAPGRNGMQPHLALTYSSQAPIYGGVANGWSLQLPIITWDTSGGRLWTQDPLYSGTKRYASSMAGGRTLVQVTESAATDVAATYRAKNDSSFTRYERLKPRMPALWRARTPDGETYAFGETTHLNGSFTGSTACSTISDANAPLTSVTDRFGNVVDYYYELGAAGECRIAVITWGENANATISDFARLKFNYTIPAAPSGCPAGTQVGAQSTYRSGTLIVTGASELDSIVATAYAPGQSATPVHTRTITLGYAPDWAQAGAEQTATCSARHAAYRSLYWIHETAVGSDSPLVDVPKLLFSYGSAQFGTLPLAYPVPPPAHSNPWSSIVLQSGGRNYNLGWGYRFNDATGRWPTVEAMMVDVDGDGLLDRLYNSPYTASDGKYYCRAQWARNLGNFVFDSTPRSIAMPTLKWATANSSCSNPNRYDGSPTPNADLSRPTEACSLNYQRTDYYNTTTTTTVQCKTEACPISGYCDDQLSSDYGTPCNRLPSPGPTYLSYRWMDVDGDGLIDLVASPTMGSVYNLEQGFGTCGDTPAPEPAILGSFPKHCPAGSYGAVPPGNAYTMCSNMYPWSVFKNHGNGQFGVATSDPNKPAPDAVFYQPVPLETDSGDSSLTSMPVGQKLGTVDLDGDGYIDAVNAKDTATNFAVCRNDFTGRLAATSAAAAFSWGESGDQLGSTDYVTTDAQGHLSPVSSSGLFDINGDGLVDHWASTGPSYTSTGFELNDGTSFRQPAGITSTVRPGNDGYLSCYGGCSFETEHRVDPHTQHAYTSGYYWIEAQRWDASRVLDADLDGRQDVVQFASGTQTPTTYLNQGSALQAAGFTSVGDQTSLYHKMVATNQLMWPAYTWEIRSDVTDLDGDGIPEDVSFADHGSGIGTMTIGKIPTPEQPPRLLVGIDNQRGATTSVWYAAMSDTTVVTRSPGLVMPKTGWVVKALTSADSMAGTSSTTTYQYSNPHYSAEGDLTKENGTAFPAPAMGTGPSKTTSFRGFDQVTATHPSGSKTTQTYSYSVDWSGRLVETIQIPAEAPSEVRSIDLTTWEARYLFCDTNNGCALKTYHPTVTEHRVCKNGQSEAVCRGNTDGVERTLSTLTGLASSTSGGQALMYAETSRQRTGAAGGTQNGDLITDTSYFLAADTTNYTLLTSSETRSSMQGSSKVAFAKTTHTFDATNKVTLTDSEWLDAAGANQAVTRRVYDMTTGNVLEHWKPIQNAANTVRTVYTYDARKLYPATEVDEIGNELDYLYEYGTGTKLETIGPNTASCVAANNCPTGTLTKQDKRIRVDGLGRTIEVYDAFSDDGSSYAPYKVETFAYVDPFPASVTHQKAISVNTSGVVTYAQDKTVLDGHGRTLSSTVYVFGSAPADQITTYTYGNDGTLRTVTVPDPTANSGGSNVTYTYGYDSLGRPTSLRRPDTSVVVDQSGVNIAYDGLTTTTSEVVKSGDGNAAITKTIKDGFGRLIEVDEELAGSPVLSWATTTYNYDAADRVTTIIDPENLTTSIGYDFAGNRSSITRPNGTWTFTYDKNNNLASLSTPHTCAVGDPCDPRYVTTYAYDNLDRMTSKLLAHRELTSADLTLFAADKETYIWDTQYGTSGNYKDHLTNVKVWAPAAGSPAIQTNMVYDAQGHNTTSYQVFAAAGYNSIGQRAYAQTFNIGGSTKSINYWDYVGNSGINTSATYSYDARGLPLSVALQRVNQGIQTTAVQTRNVAGLVTNRRTTITGTPTSPMTYVESNWTYDKLGRVGSQIVQKAPGPVLVAEQALAYFGNDDPKTLDQYLGASHKQFSYGYDLRHQLTSAAETTTSGYFSGSYTYGNAGRFTRATEASPSPAIGSEVKPRDVNYQYTGTDPEQVTALINVTAGTTYASYTYDASGNQTARCYGAMPCAGESTEYVYDGEDRLRRATKKQNGATTSSEEYWYDGRGSRVATVKRDATGAKTELIWWLRDTEGHYDAAGVRQHVYSYISLGTPVARTDRDGSGTAKLEFMFHGLGSSTLAAVDRDTGTINASFGYAPFGELVETTDGGGTGAGVAAHRRRMNDKFIDEVSDLAYYGARYYDKTSMTWTQPDPLSRFAPDAAWNQPRRANLYTNDLNNPLRYVDPDGRMPDLSGVPQQINNAVQAAPGVIVNAILSAASQSSNVAPIVAASAVGVASTAPAATATAASGGVAAGVAVGVGVGALALGVGYCISEATGGPILDDVLAYANGKAAGGVVGGAATTNVAPIAPGPGNVPGKDATSEDKPKPGEIGRGSADPKRKPGERGNPWNVPIGGESETPNLPPTQHPYRSGAPDNKEKKKPVSHTKDSEPVEDSMDAQAF